MAGTRQHVLPKFLMKGFTSRVDGEKAFCWMYRKGAEPVEVNTRHIGVENSFYEAQNGLTADERITEAEGGFSALVNSLRSMPTGARVVDPRIADFVSHLTGRSKGLRMGFQDAVAGIVDHLDDYLEAPSSIFNLVLMYPELIAEEIERGLASLSLNPGQRAMFEAMLIEKLPELLRHLAENPDPEFKAFLTEAFIQFRKVIPAVVRKGQVESLLKDPAPGPRAELYRRLNWWLVQSISPIILGDIAVLFEVDGPRRFKFIDDKDDCLAAVYIPISSNRMLIGAPGDTPPELDLPGIIQATVHNSHSFFVAGEFSSTLAQLTPEIGKDSHLLTKEGVRSAVEGVIEETKKLSGLESS